jgi:hypothetical protein
MDFFINNSIISDYFFVRSKHNIQSMYRSIEDILRRYVSYDNRINGFFIFILHSLLQLLVYGFLLFSPIYSWHFIIAFILWVFIMLTNFSFRGCFLLKLERYLWNTQSWYGPLYLFCDETFVTNGIVNNFFVCRQVLIMTIVFLRILFYN